MLFSKKYTAPELCEMRNVAGEILGAVAVIRYCLEKNIPALEIHSMLKYTMSRFTASIRK